MGLDKVLVIGHSPGKTPINKRKNGSPTLNRLNRWLDACKVDIYSFSNIYAHHKEFLKIADIYRTYVQKIISKISGEHFKNYKVNKIRSKNNGVDLYYGGKSEFFDYDKVVIATHADDALKILNDPTEDEKKILSNFKYKSNLAVIHTDEVCMPNNKKVWSSWNSSVDKSDIGKTSLTYWLNLLQNLKNLTQV